MNQLLFFFFFFIFYRHKQQKMTSWNQAGNAEEDFGSSHSIKTIS